MIIGVAKWFCASKSYMECSALLLWVVVFAWKEGGREMGKHKLLGRRWKRWELREKVVVGVKICFTYLKSFLVCCLILITRVFKWRERELSESRKRCHFQGCPRLHIHVSLHQANSLWHCVASTQTGRREKTSMKCLSPPWEWQRFLLLALVT